MSNERRHERLTVRNVVHIANQPTKPHDIEQLSNISTGGLSFRSDHFWSQGETVHIVLQADQTFVMPAIIRWCRAEAGSFRVGVEFSCSPEQNMLDALCEMDSTLAMYQATAMAI